MFQKRESKCCDINSLLGSIRKFKTSNTAEGKPSEHIYFKIGNMLIYMLNIL